MRTSIGVFDSGVGGLTVLHELLCLVPSADYLYFGDTARLPYGSKSAETVGKYAASAARFLEERGAELLVIACNTASALALDVVKAAVNMPVVGVIEPGADRAAAVSRSRHVVVIGTEATVSSHAYQNALARRGVQAHEKACPLLVPLVEEGWIEHPVTEQVAHIYLGEAFQDGSEAADVLVLGCTHYPLLKPVLRRIAPRNVQIVDSAEATAHAVGQIINTSNNNSLEATSSTPALTFFATDSVVKFRRLGERFLRRSLQDVVHVDLER